MTNATGIQNLLKNIGSAIGTSLVATMLTRFAQVHQYMLVGKLHDLNPVFLERVQSTAGALAAYTEQAVSQYMAQYSNSQRCGRSLILSEFSACFALLQFRFCY